MSFVTSEIVITPKAQKIKTKKNTYYLIRIKITFSVQWSCADPDFF